MCTVCARQQMGAVLPERPVDACAPPYLPATSLIVQGDGTAAIFGGREDVFTLSVHAASNFPARKQVTPRSVAIVERMGSFRGWAVRRVASLHCQR